METAESVIHILIVDDDVRLRELLARYLNEQGWQVTMATDAQDARIKLDFFVFDLIVLDVMMPGETGVELAASLNGKLDTPILMLTAMAESEDRISGLEAGAQDYLAKPFEPRELVLRIRNILGRSPVLAGETASGLQFGEYRFYISEERLLCGETPVYLTSAESALLRCLAERANHPVSRADLAATMPGETASERSVDVQITRLRKKIEPEAARPVWIQTVRGEGYLLRTR